MFSVKSSKNDFPKRSGKKFKVIINSGGGVFGYIISNFMSYLDFDLYSKVDLIAGTSIGGILTLAYSLQSNYQWVNKLFKLAAPKIFENGKSILFSTYKYDNRNLKKFLSELYGTKKFSELNNHTLITTTDFTLRTLRIFENINLKEEQDLPLVDLALYTSAAPTFFKAHKYPWKMIDYDVNSIPMNEKFLLNIALNSSEDKEDLKKNSSVLFDGGVLENMPIMSAYSTLHTEFGVNPEDIDMFVFGAGNRTNEKKYSVASVNSWGVLDILRNFIIPYVVESNVQTSLYWGTQMGFNSFTYYNPIEIEGKLDNLEILPKIEKQCLEHKDEFLNEIKTFVNK